MSFPSLCTSFKNRMCNGMSSFVRNICFIQAYRAGFPTGVENMGRGSIHGGACGGLKMRSKNTWEGVHLIVKLPAIILQACKFTKNELLHTYFSRILARFKL